eukprot:4844937-Prymnesium_polylepis.1
MDVVIKSNRVQAVTAFYYDDIRSTFKHYAAYDKSAEGRAHGGLETMSFSEFIVFLKQGKVPPPPPRLEPRPAVPTQPQPLVPSAAFLQLLSVRWDASNCAPLTLAAGLTLAFCGRFRLLPLAVDWKLAVAADWTTPAR